MGSGGTGVAVVAPAAAVGGVSWLPITAVDEWTDELQRERLLVFVLLPSGVVNYSIDLTNDALGVEVTIEVPGYVFDGERVASCLEQKLPSYHPKRIAMKKAMNCLKQATMRRDRTSVTSVIAVERPILRIAEIDACGSIDGCRVVLVDAFLKDEEGNAVNKRSFKMEGDDIDSGNRKRKPAFMG